MSFETFYYSRWKYFVLSILLLALSANFGYLYNKQLVAIRIHQQLLLQRKKELEAQRAEKARLERIEQERLAKELEAKRLAEAKKQRKAAEEAKRLAALEASRQAELEAIRQKGLLTISGESEGSQKVDLTVNEYSELKVIVKKGMRLEMPNGYFKELFKICYFKNNIMVNEMLVDNDNSHWSSRPGILFYYFWDNYDLKLKAAEVPHTLNFIFKLEKDKLELNNSVIGDAYFIEKGESVITNIYLDEKDRFYLKGFSFASTAFNAERNYFGINPMNPKDCYSVFRNEMGYLQINAKKRIIVEGIKLERITYYLSLKLPQNKVYQMKVYKGDVIKTDSGSRYYVNNEIMDKDRGNIHNIDYDGYLQIKGSYGNEDINLRVLKRKGY